jgi:hypothetical protein
MDLDDAFDGVGGGGVGYGSGAGYGYGGVASGRVRTPRVSINSDVAPSSRDRDRVEQLRRQRDADPTSRAAHRRLVQAAIYYGAPEAFEYARAWAEADPDHAPAMLAVADLPRRARRSDRPARLRLRRRGQALRPQAASPPRRRPAPQGRHRPRLRPPARARQHRREQRRAPHRARDPATPAPAASTSPGSPSKTASAAPGAPHRAPCAASAPSSTAASSPPQGAGLHSYPDLRASLTWSGDADLDIAVVDRLGRRLSALRPELVRVREQRGAEELTLQSINQPVYLEISRRGPAGPPSVRATLKVKASGATKSFEITSDHQTLRLAKLAWVY